MYLEERKASDFIQKIKIFFAIINTILSQFGLFYEGEADWKIHIFALIMIPLSSAIWNQTLYDELQKEKPSKISFYVFERITLIFPIILFITIVGLIIR